MNAANNSPRLIDDLAARWTDSAHEILVASGIHAASVPMELEIWRTLKDVMLLTLRRQQSLPLVAMRVEVFMKQVLFAAMLRVAGKLARQVDTFALESRLRSWMQRRKLYPVEQRLYLHMVRSALANRTAQSLKQTGYRVPRLSAVC